MAGSDSKAAVLAALAANSGIAIAKFVGFVITGSGSLLAEAAHSVADAGNQGLLLLGAKRAQAAPDETHPFGYQRERYFFAFLVAVVLFTGGAVFALREGLHKLSDPHGIDSPGVAIGILVAAIIMEIFSIRVAVVAANKQRGSTPWGRFIRRNKDADLTVVLLEDAAALLGLVLALIGVSVAAITHDPVWDAAGTIAIAVLLAVIAVVMGLEMKGLLIGEAASPEDVAAIRTALEERFGPLIHLRTEHRGPEEILVAAKVAVPPGTLVADSARMVNEAESSIRAVVARARYIFIEFDVLNDDLPGDLPAEAR